MLKTAEKVVDGTMQLQTAKESLVRIQSQLSNCKKSALLAVVKNGVSASITDCQKVQDLENQYMTCLNQIKTLERELSPPSPQKLDFKTNATTTKMSDLGKVGNGGSVSFGSSIIDDIIGTDSILNVTGMKNGKTSLLKENPSKDKKKKKGKKGKIVLPSSKNPSKSSELPPLPIEISNTMSILSSDPQSSKQPSIFSLLHPMNETSTVMKDEKSVPAIDSFIHFDSLQPEKSYQSNDSVMLGEESLPFADEDDIDADFVFEDPFEVEIERRRKAEEEALEKEINSSPQKEVVQSIDYSELKKNAKNKLDGLFGEVMQKKVVPVITDELVNNEKVVENAAVVTKMEPSKKKSKTKSKSKSTKTISIEEEVTIQKVSKLLGISVKDCISKLSEYVDDLHDKDDYVSCDAVELLAMDYNTEIQVNNQFNLQPTNMADSSHDLPGRSPVISVMGHVDHGKTTLLDYLRKTSVAAKEHGGITQAISAFNVQLSNDQRITFIDTPGHAAFTSMRKKGANATDIVLLIIAGDDGIKEQTEEVIDLIKKENLPFVVAVTKCGKKTVKKEEALKRIGNELLDYDIVTTQYGGDVSIVGIDSITGEGIEELKEVLYEESLIRELRADTKALGEGVVLESNVKQGSGTNLTTVIRWGNFHVGSVCVLGDQMGKIKSIVRDGKNVKSGVAGDTVVISGINHTINGGEWLFEVKNEAFANEVVNYRKRRQERQKAIKKHQEGEEDDTPSETPETSDVTRIPIVLKTDVEGSIQAIEQEINNLNDSIHNAAFHIVYANMGNVSQYDVDTTRDCKGILMTFNTKIPNKLSKTINTMKIKTVSDNIIYSLLDNLKEEAREFMPIINAPVPIATCEVKQTFNGSDKSSLIAGCVVNSGTLMRESLYRIIRNEEIIFKGSNFDSIRHFKDEVETIGEGKECGILISGYSDIKEGDIIETYEYKDIRQPLE